MAEVVVAANAAFPEWSAVPFKERVQPFYRFSFGGWNDSKFGVGDITGRDAIAFWTQSRKTTVKRMARQTNWMS